MKEYNSPKFMALLEASPAGFSKLYKKTIVFWGARVDPMLVNVLDDIITGYLVDVCITVFHTGDHQATFYWEDPTVPYDTIEKEVQVVECTNHRCGCKQRWFITHISGDYDAKEAK